MRAVLILSIFISLVLTAMDTEGLTADVIRTFEQSSQVMKILDQRLGELDQQVLSMRQNVVPLVEDSIKLVKTLNHNPDSSVDQWLWLIKNSAKLELLLTCGIISVESMPNIRAILREIDTKAKDILVVRKPKKKSFLVSWLPFN